MASRVGPPSCATLPPLMSLPHDPWGHGGCTSCHRSWACGVVGGFDQPSIVAPCPVVNYRSGMTLPVPRRLFSEIDQITDLWSPRVVARVNDHFLKVARVKGAFVWHQHDAEDELFLVVRGKLRIQFEDGDVELGEGECVVVPRGVRHNPIADEECWIALFEPASTAHTGDAATDRARSIADQTAHLEREP